MSFTKNFFAVVGGITGTIVSAPIAVIASTVKAIDEGNSLKDAVKDCGKMIGAAGNATADYCEEHSHELMHGVQHVAKHLLKGR